MGCAGRSSGTVLVKLGSFAMSLVLARLIAPQDFGLYAVALAANAFVIHVNDMGIIAATVQWRGRVEEMVPTGATLALVFSIGWYALFWVAAPELAQLAGSPEATPLVRLLTATILIDGHHRGSRRGDSAKISAGQADQSHCGWLRRQRHRRPSPWPLTAQARTASSSANSPSRWSLESSCCESHGSRSATASTGWWPSGC